MKDKNVCLGRCQRGEIMLFSGLCVGGTGKSVIDPQLKICRTFSRSRPALCGGWVPLSQWLSNRFNTKLSANHRLLSGFPCLCDCIEVIQNYESL